MSAIIPNRRKFLQQASCLAVGGTSLWSSLINLKGIKAMAANNSSLNSCTDFKALVCLFNSGGMDSYNFLVPTTPNEYAIYNSVRSNQALPLAQLRALNATNTPGRTFGLHPAMPNLQNLFNTGKAAMVANVGSLVAPMTKQEYLDGTVTSPLGLFSHSDQQMHWQTGFAHKRDAVGWGGKMADLLNSCNSNINVPMNITFSGTNLLQTGESSTSYSINPWNPTGGINSDYVNPMYNWWFENLKKNSLTNMVDATYVNIFEQTYKNTIGQARLGIADINAALAIAPQFSNLFSNQPNGAPPIATALKTTAQLIAQQASLGMNRMVFFIDYYGWDHHDELLNSQDYLLQLLDQNLGDFVTALDSINKFNSTTIFSLSEFSRTLTSNGNGTDHAWGANAFVLGGAVNGQKIYGEYPTSLALNGPIEVGGGVMIPTTAAEEYFAEIALWYGVPPSNLKDLYPNLPNFWSISGGHPLGFLNY